MSYYYAQNGEPRGPVGVGELASMAADGRLQPADLVNRVGDPEWIAADQVPELTFAAAAPPPPIPAAPPIQAAPPMPDAAPVPSYGAASIPENGQATDASQPGLVGRVTLTVEAGRGSGFLARMRDAATSAWTSAIRIAGPLAEKARPWTARAWQALLKFVDFAAAFVGLDRMKIVPILVGTAAMLLLVLSTLMIWLDERSSMNVFGTVTAEGALYRGISYIEGKLVFMAVAAGLAVLGVGAMKRQWLPAGLLAAAATALFCLVIVVGLRMRERARIEQAMIEYRSTFQMMEQMGQNMSGGTGENVMGDMVKAMDAQYSISLGWGMLLAALCALGATAGFAVACVFVPLPLAVFADKGRLVERYSALAGALITAFLCGAVLVVLRY